MVTANGPSAVVKGSQEDLGGGNEEEAGREQPEVPSGQAPNVERRRAADEERAEEQADPTARTCSRSASAPMWMTKSTTYATSTARTRPRQGGVRVTEAAAAAPRKPADGPASRTGRSAVVHS